jgi:hypothetical protein
MILLPKVTRISFLLIHFPIFQLRPFTDRCHARLSPSSPQRITFATLAYEPPSPKSHPTPSTDTFLDSSTFSTCATRQPHTYTARVHHHVLSTVPFDQNDLC